MIKKPVIYLNNKELLLEIHRSKLSYSSFTQPEYSSYDYILDNVENITPDIITLAKEARAKRLSHLAYSSATDKTPVSKLAEYEIVPDDIKDTDIVFRIMTYDHIPDAPGRKKTIKSVADLKAKVNFPPFIHVKYNDDHQLITVGKSHWKGELQSGKFCTTHGQLTENYASMLLTLCKNYTSRGNLHQYTYTDEMQSEAILQLTHAGLKFNEFRSDNPFSFLTTTVRNAVLRVLNAEKTMQNIRDDMLELLELSPSFTRIIDSEFAAELRRSQLS